MAKGSSNITTQSSSSAPWGPARDDLKGYMGDAQKLYDNKKGFKAFDGQGYVGQDPATQQALSGIMSQAQQGDSLGQSAYNSTGDILSGKTSLDPSQLQSLLGRSGNEAFSGVVDTQANKLSDNLARQFGGSSFGSGQMTGTMVDQVGDFRNKMTSDNWNQNIANERGILGDITGIGQQNISNQMGAAAAAPGMYQNLFAPQERMAQVGAANEDLATRKLQSEMDAFNTKQQAPWNRLNAAYGIASGSGSQGGSQTQTATSPSNWFGNAMGGGILGGQMGGLGGAAGGGLLGLLGSFL